MSQPPSSSESYVVGGSSVRPRGVEKNNAWLHTRTAALNLRKLLNPGLVRHEGT